MFIHRSLFAIALVTVLSRALAADPVNCEAAPMTAVTQLPQVASDLALVFCSPTGHALAAVDGYVWLAPDRKPFFLQSASPQGPVRGETQHSTYFTNASSRVLQGDALEKSKAMFKVEFGLPPPDGLSVTQLDLLSSKGFLYNVFFYVVSGRLDRVIACLNECNISVGLKQVSLSSPN